MSTNEETVVKPTGINLDVAFEQQSVRLLELPPALLDLIASDAPLVLQLKSAAASSNDAPAQAGPSAFVCTSSETFEVRLVHSSNILYVLQPAALDTGTSRASTAPTGMRAISQCKAVLELDSVTPNASLHLARVLPVFGGLDAGGYGPGATRDAILADAPFSEAEFDRALVALCAFETKSCLGLPSAPILLSLWKSFMAAATVKGLDVFKAFSVDDVQEMVEEDGHDAAILLAVLARLKSEREEVMDGWAILDQDKCVRWVGGVLLESEGLNGTLGLSLMKLWKDALPEAGRGDVKLKALEACIAFAGLMIGS